MGTFPKVQIRERVRGRLLGEAIGEGGRRKSLGEVETNASM